MAIDKRMSKRMSNITPTVTKPDTVKVVMVPGIRPAVGHYKAVRWVVTDAGHLSLLDVNREQAVTIAAGQWVKVEWVPPGEGSQDETLILGDVKFRQRPGAGE